MMKKIKNIIVNSIKNKYNKLIYSKQYNKYKQRIKKQNLIFNKTKTIKSKKKLKKKNLLIKFSFILLLILLFIIIKQTYFRHKEFDKDGDEDDENYIPDNKTIYFEEKFDSYFEAFNKAKDFINNNIQGKLINTKKIKLSKKPKVSVVIPCHNCQKYILRALRSIQNQNLKNFEIIIVNDGSTSETVTYIEQMQKEDDRIRILHNKQNMGLLYSRCVGTLSANGKYIFPMDSDDMFLDKDVFYVLTNIANKGNFDIIIYNSITTDLRPDVYTTKFAPTTYDRNHLPNRVLFQPDLGYYHIAPGNNLDQIYFNDELIHGKFFKTKIYKKALNKLGKERYSRYMFLGEDDVANSCIFNTARSGKFIAKYGYLFIDNPDKMSLGKHNMVHIARNFLYILDTLIDFTLDSRKNKKVLANYIIFYFKKKYLRDLLNNSEYNKLFNSCLDRIFNCKYISDEDKNEIRRRGKILDFIKYNF